MSGELLVVEQEPDIYAACSRPECGTAAGCSCPRYRTTTTADHVTDIVALPRAEAVARLVAMVQALPDEGPQPWRDGDPRCHCTHCGWCGRLYRTEDYGVHRSTCVMGLVVEAARRG